MRRWISTFLALAVFLSVGACESSSLPTVPPASSATTASTPAATVTSPSRTPTAAATNPATPTTALQTPTAQPTPLATVSAASPQAQGQINVLDVHNLPLGDGKVSTSPQTGFVYSCQTDFKTGGAQHTGPWIHGDTWDLTAKIAVEGAVQWPDAQFEVTVNDGRRVITGNGLPLDAETGIFPIQKSDPAYQIDPNPNGIAKQNISFSLPVNPTISDTPSCVPMGMIGLALNGVAIFNALDAAGRDAVAHETQDVCDGHPQSAGIYHYHGPSPCMPGVDGNAQLVGYALDGFGIYSMYDANGKEITNADLDACHGMTSEVMWNGNLTSIYHYVLTQEYPYTIGCYRGTPVRVRAEVVNADPAAVSPTYVSPSNSLDDTARRQEWWLNRV